MNIQQLSIPEPCSVDWNTMTGDERRRFCDACGKHVTHLSRLSETDAKSFLLDNPGECVQLDVVGDTILFERAEPSSTFRKGWFRKTATVGALLSLASPAFASGQVGTAPSWMDQAIEWVRSIVADEPATKVITEGSTSVIAEVDTGIGQETVPPISTPPVRIPPRMQPLGGAPRPDPAYLEKIRAEREAREAK